MRHAQAKADRLDGAVLADDLGQRFQIVGGGEVEFGLDATARQLVQGQWLMVHAIPLKNPPANDRRRSAAPIRGGCRRPVERG